MAGKPKDARQPYSLEHVDRIVTAVRLPVDAAKRAYLHGELNTAASDYLLSRDELTPAQIRDRLAAIEKATQKLLSTLGNVKETGLPAPAVNPFEMLVPVLIRLQLAAGDVLSEESQPITQSGYIPVGEVIRGIRLLQRLATRALAEAEAEVKPHGRTRYYEREWFAADLARIYRETFQKEPGVSRSPITNRPGGPFVRFVRTCLEELGERCSLETVAKLAKRGKKWDPGIISITDGDGRVLYSRDPSQ